MKGVHLERELALYFAVKFLGHKSTDVLSNSTLQWASVVFACPAFIPSSFPLGSRSFTSSVHVV